MPVSKTLLVTGMHRSATSLTASIFHAARANMGGDWIPASLDNPKGYYESALFVAFHRFLLQIVSDPKNLTGIEAGWVTEPLPFYALANAFKDRAKEILLQRANSAPVWGWKDPRTTLFLPFWQELLPEAGFCFVFRPPWEVAQSMKKAYGPSLDQLNMDPVAIWKFYNDAILSFYEKHPSQCLLVSAAAAAHAPDSIVTAARKKLRLASLQNPPPLFDAGLFHSLPVSESFLEAFAGQYPGAWATFLQLFRVSSADLPWPREDAAGHLYAEASARPAAAPAARLDQSRPASSPLPPDVEQKIVQLAHSYAHILRHFEAQMEEARRVQETQTNEIKRLSLMLEEWSRVAPSSKPA